MSIYQTLEELKITYTKHEHVPVYTCEEAAIHCGAIPGGKSKNLFLRNRKGNQHYLLVIAAEKRADLKQLGITVGEKLSLASPERLMKWLGCKPGSVSLFALINDTQGHVRVLIDRELWETNAILHYHPPNDNAATIEIKKDDLKKFLDAMKQEIEFINI